MDPELGRDGHEEDGEDRVAKHSDAKEGGE